MSENSRTTRTRKWASHLKTLLMVLGIGFLFFLFISVTQAVFLIETPVRFVLGWAFHLYKAVPSLLPQWTSLLFPLGCLALTALLVHRFALWWLAAKGSNKAWSFPRSLALLGMVLLGSAAAIAVSGIVHQLAWLPQGEVIVNTGRAPDRSMVISRTQQLLAVVEEFARTEGRYPGSLRELRPIGGGDLPDLWISTTKGAAPEPFLLIQPGAPPFRDIGVPRLISPAVHGYVIVGYEGGYCGMVQAPLMDRWLVEAQDSLLNPDSSSHE